MPVKCRSCGHLNRDQSTTCERCGCDLQYSLLFDRVIRNREEESRFLFPLSVPTSDEIDFGQEIEEDPDTEETAYTQTGNMETTDSSRLRKKPSVPISRELQEKANRWVIQTTAELFLFMVLFLILSMLARMAAPYLILPNWKLAVVSLCYDGFITFSSLYFTGKTTASALATTIVR